MILSLGNMINTQGMVNDWPTQLTSKKNAKNDKTRESSQYGIMSDDFMSPRFKIIKSALNSMLPSWGGNGGSAKDECGRLIQESNIQNSEHLYTVKC